MTSDPELPPSRIDDRLVLRLDGPHATTEALVAAGRYAYAHSCLTSDDFPLPRRGAELTCELALLRFVTEVDAGTVLASAKAQALMPPTYADALHVGAQHPDAQRAGPIVFLHDPWVGHFGRRDVISLWCNAGQREIGLDDYDGRWGVDARFAFRVRGRVP